MKAGQTVYWRDLVTHKIRKGKLLELTNTLGEIPLDEAGYPGNYKSFKKPVPTWEIKEEGTMSVFAIEEEHLLRKEPKN